MRTISFRQRLYSRRLLVVLVLALAALFALAALAIVQAQHPPLGAPTPLTTRNLDGLPVAFIPNTGQASADIRFMAHQPGGTFLFKASEISLAPDPRSRKAHFAQAQTLPQQAPPISLSFEDANPAARVQSGAMLPGKASFVSGPTARNGGRTCQPSRTLRTGRSTLVST